MNNICFQIERVLFIGKLQQELPTNTLMLMFNTGCTKTFALKGLSQGELIFDFNLACEQLRLPLTL